MDGRLPQDLEAAAALGGEMGARFAAFDWASHPLGAPETWPAEVRAVVAVALASRFPTILWLGPELFLVYNDAYIPVLSDKHPAALGGAGAEVWAEVWDVVGPMLAGVMATGVATWSEDLPLRMRTDGGIRERHFTFTYSPILAGDGRVGGVFCAVNETTERVLGERRLQALNRLAGAVLDVQTQRHTVRSAMDVLAGQADLPFVATYLADAGTGDAILEAATPDAEPLLVASAPRLSFWLDPASPGSAAGSVSDAPGRMPSLCSLLGDDCPEQALVLPLSDAAPGSALGWLVVGVAPRQTLDEQYLTFCRLVADQVAAALANARSYEVERRRAEALAELDAAKTAFFTNVSHELRTPLTLLLGPIEEALADDTEPLPPRQRHRAEMVARNAHRLLALVNTLLDFSALEAGTTRGRFQPTDLADMTTRLAVMFGSAVEQAGLRFVVDTTPLPEPVYVDREMWTRIVLNLLSNALKFTFDGGVTVALEPVDGAVELRVTDTGVGIEPAEQSHLFERFHRVLGTRSRSHEGSGIGLALVAELTALHGGSVRVQSAPGVGSTFRVRIPLGAAHLPADEVVTHADPLDAESSAGAYLAETLRWLGNEASPASPAPDPVGDMRGAPRVLVVDDNADMRDYVAALLAHHYLVDTAANGAEGLARARACPPDLVLTDVMMPHLDGFGLLAALRLDPATTAVPVVFLSARAGPDGAAEGLEAGADDYIAKPFVARELLARVRANLELDRSRRARAALEHTRELLDQTQRLARVGSWELDVATGMMVASDELLRLLGIAKSEFERIGLGGVLERSVHAGDRERVAAILSRAAADGAPFTYEMRIVRDGSERWTRVHGEALTDGGGRPVKVRGSFQDIEDQRRAEHRMAAAAAAEEASARERRIADELQAALLPSTDVDPEGLEVATYYRAGAEGTQVGGDWYDVIDLGAGRTALVLGDVMGRGVHAAAVMGQLRSAIRAYARLDLAPVDVLEYLDGVVRDLDGDQIVTCVYAVYDSSERTLTYANAGHLPPLLFDGGAAYVRLDSAGGPPLGAGPLALTEERRTSLPPGSLLALYSDGLVERPDRDIDEGIRLLAAHLDGGADGHLPSRIQAVADALLAGEPNDDVAVLLARVPDGTASQRSTERRIVSFESAVADARHFAAATVNDWSVPTDLTSDVVLAVSELVTNAILHGRPPVDVRLRSTTTELVVEVCDGSQAPPRRLRPSVSDEHGRGLALVAAVAGRWGTRTLPDGKCVWCTFALEPALAGADACPSAV